MRGGRRISTEEARFVKELMYPNDKEDIINKPCLICGRRNIEHMAFFNPYLNWFQKHTPREGVTDNCVPNSDHYACIDNLEYLEYLNEKKNKR